MPIFLKICTCFYIGFVIAFSPLVSSSESNKCSGPLGLHMHVSR
uniref:Uncharacterized protein n=1 Tax=Rhizophora mucronata TaxID=61149 RepID=A0A2P2QT78_RHIMU